MDHQKKMALLHMSGKKNSKKFNVIDLFAGAGGISSGFKKAGFNVIAANEYDPEIAETYVKNHPGVKIIVEDITKVKSEDFLAGNKEVHIIVGGPPCQGFSLAGRRIRNNGAFLNDHRNELFKEFYRVVKDLKPKIFIMENVAAILNIYGGAIKDEIIKIFRDIGYKTEVNILLAAEYGVPQLRKRAVFIGNRIGIDPKKMYPDKTHGLTTKIPFVTSREAIFDLPFIASGEGAFESDYDKKSACDYQKKRRKNSKKLYNHQAPLHSKRIIEILKKIKEGQGRASLPPVLRTKSIHSGSFGRIDRNKPAYTITTRFDTPSVGKVTHPVMHRALTPREAARIQSFDDDFIFLGNRSSIGKQIGNAVPPLMAFAIAKKIIEWLD